MSYYHNLITSKSWQELKTLRQKVEFVLIGGWAVYLFTKGLKSKDIDILIEYDQLGKLSKTYEMSKNDRLKKYEARRGEVQIDVYLPHYSQLGVGVDRLMSKTVKLDGFTVLKKEWLLMLKLITLSERGRSAKGRKDFLDILSLWQTGVEVKELQKIIDEFKLKPAVKNFYQFLNESVSAEELGLNQHQYKRVKDTIRV